MNIKSLLYKNIKNSSNFIGQEAGPIKRQMRGMTSHKHCLFLAYKMRNYLKFLRNLFTSGQKKTPKWIYYKLLKSANITIDELSQILEQIDSILKVETIFFQRIAPADLSLS